MIRPTIKYSILCGFFLVALFYISLQFGSNPLLEPRHFFFDLAVFFLFIFFAGKEHKDFRNDGIFHFWQGISIGFIVIIPAAIIFSVFLYVIFRYNHELIDQYREGARIMLDAQKDFYLENLGEEGVEEQYQLIEERTPGMIIARNSGWKLLTGFLVTPVAAIILRKKPK